MNIFQIIKKQEQNLLFGKPIKIGKYAEHDHTEKVSTITAYLNSQHISGKRDSQGREKPFLNIVIVAAYVWYKLTNISRRHIKFRAPNSKKRLKALVATLKLREWMNKKNFGQWLNKWGWTLSCYGSAVSKFIEKDGKLIPSVISWDRMICDPVDFDGNPKIEKIYYTPAQLRQQPYNPDRIEEAIKSFKDIRENIDGEDIDVSNEYIGVYEVHGNLPLSLLTDREEDENIYRQQMHVVFIIQNENSEDTEISLYRGKEEKDPYVITHLLEQEGRTLSIGAVESNFDPQWMVNDMAKKTLDQFEIASKLVMQTSDPNFVGKNYLKDFDTGFVAVHEEGKPLNAMNNQSHDIPQIMSFLDLWKQQSREISGSHESVTGQTLPSGTPYRLGMMLNQEARGLFDVFRENKGLSLEYILRTHVIPHFKKTLKTTDELVAILYGEELEEFDKLALPANLQKQIMLSLKKDHIPTQEEMMSIIDEENRETNVRVITPSKGDKTWKDVFKDFEWDVEIDITGESRDKSAVITSLDTLFQRMIADPEAFGPEDRRRMMNKIIDEIGPDVISPLQIKGISPQGATGGESIPRGMDTGQVGMPELTEQLR